MNSASILLLRLALLRGRGADGLTEPLAHRLEEAVGRSEGRSFPRKFAEFDAFFFGWKLLVPAEIRFAFYLNDFDLLIFSCPSVDLFRMMMLQLRPQGINDLMDVDAG